MAVSFLTELPYDIKELILSNINSTNDLASFARTSKEWASLIIPHHIAYRSLRLRKLRGTPQPLRLRQLFTYLAQRVDVCRNIRYVYMNELLSDFDSEIVRYPYATPESFMMSIDKQDSSVADDLATEIGISHALSSMDGLLKFTWEFPWGGYITNSDAEKKTVFTILCRSRTLRTLELLDFSVIGPLSLELRDDITSLDYPLWHISDLTSLTLRGIYWSNFKENSNLTELLKRSPNLEELDINYAFNSPSFIPCHFPKLRDLTLWPGSCYGEDDGDAKILDFLFEHPTVQCLNWTPSSTELEIPEKFRSSTQFKGFLPNLKRIVSTQGLLAALILHRGLNVTDSEPHTCSTSAAPSLALTSSISHPQNYCALKSISYISLVPRTMHLLEYISGPELTELHLCRYETLSMLERVGDLFPNIEILEVPMLGVQRYQYVEDSDYHGYRYDIDKLVSAYETSAFIMTEDRLRDVGEQEDYIELLAHFPSLRYLLGTVIWSLLPSGRQPMVAMVSKLARKCPKLTHIGNRDSDDETSDAYTVLFREVFEGNWKVRWEYRGSREDPSPVKE